MKILKSATWIICTIIIMTGLVAMSHNIAESEAEFSIIMDDNTLEAINNMDEIVDAQNYCFTDSGYVLFELKHCVITDHTPYFNETVLCDLTHLMNTGEFIEGS